MHLCFLLFFIRIFNYNAMHRELNCTIIIYISHTYTRPHLRLQLKQLGLEIAIRLPIAIRKGRIAIQNFGSRSEIFGLRSEIFGLRSKTDCDRGSDRESDRNNLQPYGWRLRSDCRSRSEKVGSRSKIFDRDPRFSDRDPKRIAIGGRIENRIETISNPRKNLHSQSLLHLVICMRI
jgi:hypothetical protein